MVRCRKYLEIIHQDGLITNAARVGEYLQGKLRGLEEEFPKLVSNARGRGLYCAFDLPDAETRDTIKSKAYDDGLVILGSGTVSMRFRPPLLVTEAQIDEGVGILGKVLRGESGR